jgi:general stress protein YciG
MKQRRGFAAMPADRQRAIASKGGTMAHLKGTAYEWTPQDARDAGKKGGLASAKKRWGTGPKEAA